MLIGLIDFRNPKKRFRMKMSFYDLKELLYDYRLARKNIVITCKACGQLLAPCVSIYGPKSAGWKKEKTRWICHQCYYGWNGFDKSKEEVVEERNAETLKKLDMYKMYRPWAKIKYR